MRYQDSRAELGSYRDQIVELRSKMRAVQAETEPEPVDDYVLLSLDGSVRLSALFRGKQDLIVIHNMGASCPYCTLWADGFNGIYDHLTDRAAFVVCTPDAPDVQCRFATGRGWRFPMVSHKDSRFARDMGYQSESGGSLPGVSVFRRTQDGVVRVADTGFHPGDDFCALWHMLGLLPDGGAGWQPRFKYDG